MLYDKDIREPLYEFMEMLYGKVRILEEKNIGGSRADVLMVAPGAIFGIEIKSDADSYTRLASQVKDYDRFCDYCYVVAGSSHAAHVDEHVPAHWGIITVEEEIRSGDGAGDTAGPAGTPDFYILRRPERNPKDVLKAKLMLLWRMELAHIQEQNGMHAYKQKSKDFVREKIVETVPADVLHDQISEELFERDYTTVRQKINEYRMSNDQKPRRRRKYKRRRKKTL